MAAEGMNRPRSRNDLAAVWHASQDEMLLSGFHGNAFAVNDLRVAALYYDHVLIEVVDVSC
jgi:hypothetical protein